MSTVEAVSGERRAAGRRVADVQREMLEESIRELPNYFVTVLDDAKGLYSFYYNSFADAQDMVESLTNEGVSGDNIAVYQRNS